MFKTAQIVTYVYLICLTGHQGHGQQERLANHGSDKST